MDAQFDKARARIFKQLNYNHALDKMLHKQFDKILVATHQLIIRTLEEIGNKVVNEIRNNINSTSGSGRNYQYVDMETGEVLYEWTASASGDPPVSLSGTLYDNIEWKIDWSDDAVEVGVWSNDLGGLYPTSFYKSGKLYTGGKNDTQTPVSEYAYYLEEGTKKIEAKHFIKNAFDEIVVKARDEIRKGLKKELESMFGRKISLHFRINVKD